MDDHAETVQKQRTLSKEGIQVRVTLYRELWREISRYFDDVKDETRIRARVKGEKAAGGEPLSDSRGFAAFVAWLTALSDEDRDRVSSEGGDLLRECDAQGPAYIGKLPFDRNTESVFRPISATPSATETKTKRGMRHPAKESPQADTKPRKRG